MFTTIPEESVSVVEKKGKKKGAPFLPELGKKSRSSKKKILKSPLKRGPFAGAGGKRPAIPAV